MASGCCGWCWAARWWCCRPAGSPMPGPKAAGAGAGTRAAKRSVRTNPAMTELIFKVVARVEWEASSGDYEGSVHDRADGFLHFSTAAQLASTLQRHYAGQDDLI